jgi:DNA-binding MarR family transcriptional regulator
MAAKRPRYVLDNQVGYVLRQVTQRHLAIFSEAIPGVTPPQFAVLARLTELGPLSQNLLGRAVGMDGATVKGVVDRMERQGLVVTSADPDDKRRLTVTLTDAGATLFADSKLTALEISSKTLAPLDPEEQVVFLKMLGRLT